MTCEEDERQRMERATQFWTGTDGAPRSVKRALILIGAGFILGYFIACWWLSV